MKKEATFWNELRSGRFVSLVKEAAKGQSLANSREVYHVIRSLAAEHDDVEVIYGIFLDGQNRILAIEKLSSGSISSSPVYPREIIKQVLSLKAAALILAHNHPSGNTTPSAQDKAVTQKVAIALFTIDVPLHDHIVVGDGYYSMADQGMLQEITAKLKTLIS